MRNTAPRELSFFFLEFGLAAFARSASLEIHDSVFTNGSSFATFFFGIFESCNCALRDSCGAKSIRLSTSFYTSKRTALSLSVSHLSIAWSSVVISCDAVAAEEVHLKT